jgi:hypothetical protein
MRWTGLGLARATTSEVDGHAHHARPIGVGRLKIGDVLFVPEIGCYERIDDFKEGYGNNYQDVDGKMVYDSSPAR